MKTFGRILLFIIPVLLGSCKSSNSSSSAEKKPELWSVRMANSVMNLNDSLIYFEGRDKIRWQYDVAMLAMAIDKLGVIDPKYSDYMKSYMDFFLTKTEQLKIIRSTNTTLTASIQQKTYSLFISEQVMKNTTKPFNFL
jgi:unsaturated rhamnogalacturonyl hydrolase